MNAADLMAGMKQTVEQLAAFHEIAKALTSTLEIREVLTLVMQQVSQLMRPSNWSLLLVGDDGKLHFEICVGEGAEKLKGMRISPGEGIAGTVFQTGIGRLVDDVGADPGFARRFDDASGFPTKSLLAVPLKCRGKVLGVIELVNGVNQPPFTEEDLRTVSGVADYSAIAIENARNFQRVQELTITDEHTGLYNARHLRALLDMEVARALRFRHPLSLIFIDLDHFKKVNDTHGHLVGSALLKEVGQLLASLVRQVDSAFRYGGDEFAIVLLESDADAAKVVCERILERFRSRQFLAERGMAIKLGCSLGVASLPVHAKTALELIHAADQAMYRAKSLGRNGLFVSETEVAGDATVGPTT
jgi:diguanylate cyclase (GGDEF)-like protein